MNLEKFASQATRPRTKDVPVPELAGLGLFDAGEPLVWTLRNLTAAELHRSQAAKKEAMQRVHEALTMAMAGSPEAVDALRAAADQTSPEFSHQVTMVAMASVSPAVGESGRDAIVKLSELRPIVFARLVGEVSELFVQGGEVGKPARSGKTAG